MMATAVAWAKPNAWTLDFEEHKGELLQQENRDNVATSQQPLIDFPSLIIATTTKPKKKKGQMVSLVEFTTYSGTKMMYPSHYNSLTYEDLMMLRMGLSQ